MAEHANPSKAELERYLVEKRNWGRWGKDDERGAINLITAQKMAQAASLVRSGRTISLSREFTKRPAPINPNPAQHYMRATFRADGSGGSGDYLGIYFHGLAATHIDALCHVWGPEGMYNGRDARKELTFTGATFGDISQWSDGIVTRGVLLDIPRHRKAPFVTGDKPIHGWELEEAARAQGVGIGPGDALVVHCGREAWYSLNPSSNGLDMPGLHASCLPFVRDHDLSMIVWDCLDAQPGEYGVAVNMHRVIPAFGIALVDNALVQPLADACAQEQRYEFMLVVAPLVVKGGTGSPVNPIAIL